jgi:copper resistance protein B
VEDHAVHEPAIHFFVLADRIEWQAGTRPEVRVDTRGWIGGDRDRLWFRAEGAARDGRVDEAQAHVLFGRRIRRWWDVVGGVRQDIRPGGAQTWAAIGIQGLAPYWFDVEVTAYVGGSGRTQFRAAAEYELLLTNRLILQPHLEAVFAGKSDPERGIGAGPSATDAGFRVRYEIRRELAPYAGVVWTRAWRRTAELAEAGGDEAGRARFVTGLRLWF